MTATLVTPETLAALVAGQPAHVVIGAVTIMDFFGDRSVKLAPAKVSALHPTPCPECFAAVWSGDGDETLGSIRIEAVFHACRCTGLVPARLGVGVAQCKDPKRAEWEAYGSWRHDGGAVDGAVSRRLECHATHERRHAIVGTAAVIETLPIVDWPKGGDYLTGGKEVAYASGQYQAGDTVLTLADYQALAEPVTRSGINHAPARYTLPLVLTAGVLTEVEQ